MYYSIVQIPKAITKGSSPTPFGTKALGSFKPKTPGGSKNSMANQLSHKAITFFERRPPPSFPRDRPRRSTRQCSRKWRCWQRRLRHGRRHGRHAPADLPEEKTRHALTAGLLRLHEDVDRLSPARVPPLHVHHHPRKRADSTFALTSAVRPRHFLTGDTCTHARRCLPDLWQISGKGRAEQRRTRHDSIGDRGLWHGASRAHTHERFVRW